MPKLLQTLPYAALALLASPAAGQTQDYDDLPPLAPMGEAELRGLPSDMRNAPVKAQTSETITTENGVETITRTRRIENPAPTGQGAVPSQPGYYPNYPLTTYAPPPAYAPAVFERQQWIDECRRRTDGRGKNNAGLLGRLFGGGDDDEDRYDCEAALDSYLASYGAVGPRIASRAIPSPAAGPDNGYGYPAGYAYAPAQVVLVPVRTEVQQQVVVRETVREEPYTAPGAARIIPAPAPTKPPSSKMIGPGDR